MVFWEQSDWWQVRKAELCSLKILRPAVLLKCLRLHFVHYDGLSLWLLEDGGIQIQFILNVHVSLKPVAALKVGLIDSLLSFKECISNVCKELNLLTLHNCFNLSCRI